MFIYEKKLEFPVRITKTDPNLASLILTQFGGANCNSVYMIILIIRLRKSLGVLVIKIQHHTFLALASLKIQLCSSLFFL